MTLLPTGAYPLAIFLAGGLGTLGRWAVQLWMIGVFGPAAGPMATALVNISGCLLFGLLLGWMAIYEPLAPWRPVLLTGLLGGWTTFSTWTAETVPTPGALNVGWIALYGAGQWLTGWGAYWVGLRLAAWLPIGRGV